MLNGLDLFSGIGGIALGLESWVHPIAYCEKDQYAQAGLLSLMSSDKLLRAPIWEDIRTLTAEELPSPIDIIYGGFPCQDISQAGTRGGLGEKRSGLYWELHRLAKEIMPRWVFLENVPGIRTRGLISIIRSLNDLGYDCRWTSISAAEVGAPHIRKRWFLLGHTKQKRLSSRREISEVQKREDKSIDRSLPWPDSPELSRMAHGLPFRVDRIKTLGNAAVPAQVSEAFERLMGL